MIVSSGVMVVYSSIQYVAVHHHDPTLSYNVNKGRRTPSTRLNLTGHEH